jgi:hypothetical protein
MKSMIQSLRGLFLVGMMVIVRPALAQSGVVTLESTITGSQEQPKVITIVPWQDPPSASSVSFRLNRLDSRAIMQPVDREQMQREVDFYHRLQREAWQAAQDKAANPEQ